MTRDQAEGVNALTEKVKETLRLIVRGHDAKSIARHLGLSVHTVNERLRFARRKMAVSSSREAARMLLKTEGDLPYSHGDMDLGDAGANVVEQGWTQPEDQRAAGLRLAWTIGGTIIMSLLLAALLLTQTPPTSAPPTAPAPGPQAAVAPAQSATTAVAERWLALLDAGDWQASWLATAQSFRDLNTLEAWTAASEQARAPLDDVRSRSVASYDRVPAPPHGYAVVRFRSSFANRPDAIETVSLAREGDEWKVAGISIE